MHRTHLYTLASCLAILGVGLFLYKAYVLEFPLSPQAKSDMWNIEAHVSFVGRNEPVKVLLHIPSNSREFTIVDESFISMGYGLTTAQEETHGNRQAIWAKRKVKGKQTLYYRAVVRRINGQRHGIASKLPDVEPSAFEGPYFEAAQSLIAEIREKSADIDTFVAGLFNQLNTPEPDGHADLLLGRKVSLLKRVEVATMILAQAGIPARIVQGIRLEDQNRLAPVIQWLEVHDGKRWRHYDPETGESKISEDYLAWWRGTAPLGHLSGGNDFQTGLAVNINQEAAITAAVEQGETRQSLLTRFSLFSLPIQTQAVYKVLLLIPLGAFLLVVFRNVVGVKTFGTFMPVLMALAFRETQLLWGMALFSVLVALGLAIRFYLDRLKLLLVPRLASVLIVVVLLMAGMSVLTNKLGLGRGLSVALFPMVIMTMTIERMFIVWEERGASEAFQQAGGTLVVSSLTYLIMTFDYVKHVTFVFPELLLLLLAATLLLGRYTGYRLLELGRFKALVAEKPCDSD